MKETIKINKNNTKMIAHRGLSGLEKENTIVSFVAAGSRSYYGMECDIHPTIDNDFVVVHDDDLLRLAGCEKIVRASTVNELQHIYLLDNNDQQKHCHLVIPTFKQYLKTCCEYQKVAVVEYKHYFNDQQLAEVIRIVQEFDYLEQTIFISFEKSNLIRLREKYPFIKLQFLCSKYSEDIFNICQEYNFDLDIHYGAVTPRLIEKFHNASLKVNAWTVDQAEDAQRLIAWGIDYITTNILE